jgi:hypothetical protein
MIDPYRLAGEMEKPLPEPQTSWWTRNKTEILGGGITLAIALLFIFLFGWLISSCFWTWPAEEAAREKIRIEAIQHTCQIEVLTATSKFCVVSFDEKGQKHIESFHDTKAEAEEFMQFASMCHK